MISSRNIKRQLVYNTIPFTNAEIKVMEKATANDEDLDKIRYGRFRRILKLKEFADVNVEDRHRYYGARSFGGFDGTYPDAVNDSLKSNLFIISESRFKRYLKKYKNRSKRHSTKKRSKRHSTKKRSKRHSNKKRSKRH